METTSNPASPTLGPGRALRFPELQGARGLLALGVMFCHADVRPAYWLISMMDCFFALSAFLITLSLLEWQGPTVGSRMRHFYVRRIARIFPGYYALLFGVALLMVAINLASSRLGLRVLPLSDLLPYVFYVQFVDLYGSTNELAIWDGALRFVYHTWSLALEEQFYVLWGLLFFVAHRPWMKVGVAAVFIVVGIASRASGLVVSPLLPYRLDAFGYGIAIALVYHYCVAPGLRVEQVRGWSRMAFVAMVLAMAVFLQGSGVPMTYYRWLAADEPIAYFQWTPMSILSSFGSAALVMTLALGSGSRWASMLRRRSALYLGKISYALYLVHYPILDVLLYINHRILPFGHWINAAIGMVLAILCAHILTGGMIWAQRRIIEWMDPDASRTPRPAAQLAG